MTITLQAVNELIQSLESAGELSIKERKYLELAKEFRICSASLDAAIKTGNILADENAALALTFEKCREIVGCPAGVDLQDHLRQLAAENVGIKAGRKFFMYSDDAGFETYQTQEEAIKAAEEMIDDYREDAGDGWPEEAGTTRWGVIIQQATECDYEKPSAENGWLGWCDYKLLPETPATDRIVAGIKADGVEEFAAKLRIPGDDPFFDAVADGVAGAADDFAKQLREGAK